MNSSNKVLSNMRKSVVIIVLATTVFLFTGCSTSQNVEVSPKMRVSVKSGGAEVRNLDEKLVNYYDITPQQIKNSSKQLPKKLLLPLSGQEYASKDRRLKGIKITKVKNLTGYSNLGLKTGDIVTAIGSKKAKSMKDFTLIFSALKKRGKSSLTFERQGKPHKNIFILSTNK